MLAVESVWDYPRPPRLEPAGARIRIVHGGVVVADTMRAMRVLETSHPPVYYIPPRDVAGGVMQPSVRRGSYCEFKGNASYWDVVIPGVTTRGVSRDAAWSYADPTPAFTGLRDHLAFYASRVDQCMVDDEVVIAQPGDFYGGWITKNLRGPFKGPPGTMGW
jgi:uncharacterized protein (DUF427 family)